MQDNVMPTGKWEFNQEVTDCFDEMLERSIPNYDDMRDLVRKIGWRFVKQNRAIVDIGCSDGLAVEPFVRKYALNNTFYLFDVSEPMLEACGKRFGYRSAHENFYVQKYDITQGLPDMKACLVLSVLTLQFTPIEYRQKIVQSIYDRLEPGSALIMVEKVLGNTNEIDELLVDEYYRLKAENSYTAEQIAAKRKSLEGVLVPITARWNEDLLRSVGFQKIDCFWRYLNFAGWLAIK